MSKKKLLEFGLKEADAFKKNFKIFFDRLVRGYKSVMNREPEGLDLLKIKMEAREKALNTTKVVNQKGLTLDPDKPIIGGTQEGIETIKTKFDLKETQDAMLRKEMKELDENMKFFQKEIDKAQGLDEFNLSKDDPMGDFDKIIKGEGKTGLPKEGVKPFKYRSPDEFDNRKEYERYLDEVLGPADDVFGNPTKDQMLENFDKVKAKNVTPGEGIQSVLEEELGVKLYGDETFDELMIIKNTGKHPRDMADGGRIGLSIGGPSNIIGSDLSRPGAGLLGGMEVGEDEFSDIEGQTAGLGVASFLTKTFGPTLGNFIFQRGKTKAFKMAQDKVSQEMQRRKQAQEAAEQLVKAMAISNRMEGRGGYQSSFGGDSDFMGGSGTAAEMGSFADGGIATMFVEKK